MKASFLTFLVLFSFLSQLLAEPLTYRQTLEIWDSLHEPGVPMKGLAEWSQQRNAYTDSNRYSAGLRDGLWIRFYTRTEQIFEGATPFVMLGALTGIVLVLRRFLRAPLQHLVTTRTIVPEIVPLQEEATPNAQLESSTLRITPAAFFFCVAMAVPAVLAAKFVTHGLFDPFIAGFYRGSDRSADETYRFLTQFVSCALGGFVFVWVGALCTKRLRSFSVWFFATFSVLGAVALDDVNGAMGVIGQILGSLGAAFLFWKK